MRAARPVFLFSAALITACHPSPSAPSSDPELTRLETRMDAHEEALSRTAALVGHLDDQWRLVADDYNRAATRYRRAQAEYDRASAQYSRSSAQFRSASQTWKEAKSRWELVNTLIIAAASIDAYNLSKTTGASDVDLDSIDCGRVSTAKYRRQLRTEGIALDGLDVDHIVPRSLGGADHPSNYQLLSSSLNRSLGATWNADKCSAAGVQICAVAVAVSKLCGTFAG